MIYILLMKISALDYTIATSYSKSMIKKNVDQFKRSLVRTSQRITPINRKDPDELFGHLFHEVQAQQIYQDGKTFVDVVPKKRWRRIQREYLEASKKPDFNLQEFVNQHFYDFNPSHAGHVPQPAESARQHVTQLWPQLRRQAHKASGSLIPLPYDYIVPGGRFSEQFYWDTYFIMLGLAVDNQWELIDGMMKNYSYMIQRFGYIPTANRTYFLSRSQPPFFSAMVKLLAMRPRKVGGSSLVLLEYFPLLLTEYKFWMKGHKQLDSADQIATGRVVKMPNGTVLNRYFDNKNTPRPESRREDIETAQKSLNANKAKIYLDLRAGAESGWDFSSRWFGEACCIETIQTTDIVPVDLNCLLYDLEMTIAQCYGILKQKALRKKFIQAAENRAEAIRTYCWNEATGFFYDYNFRTGRQMPHATLAGVFPLYNGVATKKQAEHVAEMLQREFLRDGGLRMTLVDNGQQWDAPNGWAPLQWTAVCGLKRYGLDELAEEIRTRWLASTERVFADKGKMIEKYDVDSESRIGGGGEYPLQDGFGWTNGVYAALYDRFDERCPK